MAFAPEDDRIDDETPLLGTDTPTRQKSSWRPDYKTRVKILVLLYGLVANFCGSTFIYPNFRLLQHMVCYTDAKRMGLEEMPLDYDAPLCLTDSVQIDVAFIIAYRRFFMIIPSALTTMAYGRLADTLGRRPVLVINLVGMVLFVCWLPFLYVLAVQQNMDVDPRTLWAAALLFFVGGGEATFMGLMHAMLTDVLKPSERFRYFSFFMSVNLLPDVISPPLGAWMSDQHKWLPYWMILPYILVLSLLLFITPETLKSKRRASSMASQDTLSDVSHDTMDPITNGDSEDLTKTSTISKDFYRSIFKTRTWLLLVVILFLYMSINLADQHFIQYCLRIIDWSLQQASFQTSASAVVSGLIGIVLLPFVYSWAHSPGRNDTSRLDLAMASCCIIALGIASLIRGLSTNSVAFVIGCLLSTFGKAALPALKSLGSPVYAENMQSQFFAMISIFELCAGIVADPAAGALFSRGLELGGAWVGLMYDVSAFSAFFAFAVLLVGYEGVDLFRKRAKTLRQAEV